MSDLPTWVQLVAGSLGAATLGAAAYVWGLRERRRRLRRAVLKGPNGVERIQFQSADDGAMEIIVRRKDLKAMLKGDRLEGLLQGAGGAKMLFRLRSVL